MFTFKLELKDGTPADPPTFAAAVPNWKPGDTIPLGSGRSLRVVERRAGTRPKESGVLVVEPA